MASERTTVIIMNHSGTARRFSIRRWCLVSLCVLYLTLAVLGGIGIFIGWDVLQARNEWAAEKQQLLHSLSQNRMEIDRLNHLMAEAEKRSRENPSPAESVGQENGVRAVYDSTVDKEIVRIVNPVFRRVTPQSLRLVMEMYSVNPPSTINGRVMFSLKTSDGNIYPLAHDDASFYIMRFRKFVITASLPPVSLDMDGASVVLEVLADGEIIYRRTYPLQTEMSSR